MDKLELVEKTDASGDGRANAQPLTAPPQLLDVSWRQCFAAAEWRESTVAQAVSLLETAAPDAQDFIQACSGVFTAISNGQGNALVGIETGCDA